MGSEFPLSSATLASSLEPRWCRSILKASARLAPTPNSPSLRGRHSAKTATERRLLREEINPRGVDLRKQVPLQLQLKSRPARTGATGHHARLRLPLGRAEDHIAMVDFTR